MTTPAIPIDILNKMEDIQALMQNLQMEIEAGDSHAASAYIQLQGQLQDLQNEAKKDKLPQNLLNQIHDISNEFAKAFKDGHFTKSAVDDINNADEALAAITNPPHLDNS